MKRNKFSLSNTKLLSCDMGELVPIGLTEVLPGDTFQHATSLLLRVSPLLAPVMHTVHVRIHHWFVPHRLVWEDFESFITGGADGYDESVFPTITLTYNDGSPATGTNLVGELPDYLGVPPGVDGLEVSALPFRAYALIYNEWYRDQDLIQPLPLSKASGDDTTTNVSLQNAAWEKDYFTSARPWTQKGPEIGIPVSGTAPVVGQGEVADTSISRSLSSGTPDPNANVFYGSGSELQTKNNLGQDRDLLLDLASGLVDPGTFTADLQGTTAVDINDLRLAFALQRYEEARARYGSRYTEYLRYLGVRSSDARLQRPEYLGGGKQAIQFSEVLQTAEGESPVGELRGHGISAVRSNRYRRFFEEHGYVMSLLSVRPKTIYQQGLPRTFNRRTKEDFWQRELEHIGQQEVLNKELYAPHSEPDGVFGYQDRYDEYRRQESNVHGEFRTTALDFWHMGRIFASEPVLNGDFVTSTPTKRINAVQTEDVLWIMARHSIQARRQLSKTGKSYIY
ncbi:MAG: major capsid protein [Candidatus Methanomethylicaceae archaeon]